MKLLTVQTQLALSIAIAIGLGGLSGCSTKEPKVAQEEVSTTSKVEIAKLKKSRIVEDEADVLVSSQPMMIQQDVKTDAGNMVAKQQLMETKKMHRYAAPPMGALSPIRKPSEPLDRENYAHFDDNGISLVAESPVSTFSIDVDTGAYTNVRRMLTQGQIPRKDAVRAEEFINYFSYDFAPPSDGDVPFAVHSEMMKSPWGEDSYLLQLGVKAWEPADQQRPDANLVFLMDVSGSMNSDDKLGLLKKSLTLLTRKLGANDRISMVVYAGASGIVLEPTPGNQTAQIELALQRLQAGGSTNGAAGIKLAYQLAEQSFIKDGINRILLATDGDFNVGTTNFNALIDLIEEKRKSGIALSTLGFGSGNYNDHLMEQLADKGNGQYSYIDSLLEARKVLVDEINSSLLTVAGDVKIQLEFNPEVVSEYRLIGYENRALARKDFNNDKVDAGDIGAGHTVTALYEIRFTDSSSLSVDPLRYANKKKVYNNASDELGFLKLRYKTPGESTSKLINRVLDKEQLLSSVKNPTDSIKFAVSVAAFAQQLRGGKYLNDFNYKQITELARSSKGSDPRGIRGEFLQLVSLAEMLSQRSSSVADSGGE